MITRISHRIFSIFLTVLMIGVGSSVLSSCMEDDKESNSVKYAEWREKNENYVKEAESRIENGKPYFTKIVPDWAPEAYSLVHWHNDRKLTEKNLSPLDNSTVQITYELFDIEGNLISDSFANTDSVYSSRPSSNIIGVWSTLTNMHIGDSVTIVMPSQAAYGERNYGGIKPYSALVYNIKLKGISAYEIE